MTTITETAERILDAGYRAIIKDNYEQRLDYFAQEMAGKDRGFQAQVIAEIIHQDPGAFDSWLRADRLHDLTNEGLITSQEATDLLAGFKAGVDDGTIAADALPGTFVRETGDQDLITSYIGKQDLNDRGGFERALTAFTGIGANALPMYLQTPSYQAALSDFKLAVQAHQDWFEGLTTDITITPMTANGPGLPYTIDSKVGFSKEQLQALRDGFTSDDGLLTNGELLLAYPDRQERNERVTEQYYQLSQQMAGIVGGDNANWATFATWASDEIGRNLAGNLGIALGETAFGDPRFWLSKGNSMLISDIGPAFQHFVDTFGDGRNADMSFEQFWSGFEGKYTGRGISYLDGNNDPELDMKNAFKAYYDAMQLHRQEAGTSDPAQRSQLADQRAQLMLYGNTLVGLQEQYIVDHDISEGMKAFGIVNPGGASHPFIDFHLPGQGGQGEMTVNTDLDMADTPNRVNFDQSFTTADGKTIDLGQAMRDRLNGLDGDPGNEDETDPANSGTDHWESYSQRMGTIYHLFANYQQYDGMFENPRDLFDSRAQPLNNEPHIFIP